MGLVVAALALLLAGCYAPALRDCTVTCAAADQCASGQVCGSEGYCVGETGARCTGSAAVDARAEAIPIDAAVPTFALHVTVMGHGSVTVAGTGGGTCTMDCTYALPRDSQVSATELGAGNHQFQMWTTANCAGQEPTCTFTLAQPQSVGAKFE